MLAHIFSRAFCLSSFRNALCENTANFDTFRVRGKDLLSGEVKVTLAKSSILALPSEEFPKLELNATGANNSTIEVDAATQDPVLKLKKIDVAAGKTLKMNRPKTWWKNFSAGDEVALLKADVVELNGTGRIEGDPSDDAAATIEWKDADKALVLTAKAGFKVPELSADVNPSGKDRIVNVKVSGDVLVDPLTWRAELVSVDEPGSVQGNFNNPNPKDDKSASFKVELGPKFKSGILRTFVF